MKLPNLPEQINYPMSVDVAHRLEKTGQPELSTEIENNKNSGEKKKRPEELVDSLAAMVSVAWAKQPPEMVAMVEQASGVNLKVGSTEMEGFLRAISDLASSQHSSGSAQFGAELSSQTATKVGARPELNSTADGDTAAKKVADLNGVKASKIAQHDQVDHQKIRQDHMIVKESLGTRPVESASRQNLTQPAPVISPLFSAAPSNPGAQSGTQFVTSYQADKVSPSRVDNVEPGRGRAEATTPREEKFDLDQAPGVHDRVHTKRRSESDREDADNIAGSMSAMAKQNPTIDQSPVLAQQPASSGTLLKQFAEQSKAAQAANSVRAPEGIKYSLQSWGADKSVQITGSTQKGYKLEASDNEVKQILKKYATDTLNANITSAQTKEKLDGAAFIQAVDSADGSDAS